MDEREMSKEEFHAMLDAAHERARKELKKHLRKARSAPPHESVDWGKFVERHEAAIQAIQRAREAGQQRRAER